MEALSQIPVLATTQELAQLAGTSHGVVQRLVLRGEIIPAAYAGLGNRRQELFDPAVAAIVVGLIRRPAADHLPPVLATA